MINKEFCSYLKLDADFLFLKANSNSILSISFVDKMSESIQENDVIFEAKVQLQEYFDGNRIMFDVPLQLEGTDFQKKVWNLLMKIPFGKTVSYLDLAKMVGDANATRAVATANGKNPIAIIIPCHRVIGSDGSLTGYAGGLGNKQMLLSFESKIQSPTLF
jgi:methylated-DNA-[protein]-cysteine S-methyltransferase